MKTRTLGQNGPAVSALGLGCIGMSDLYGPADRMQSIATVHAALDFGILSSDFHFDLVWNPRFPRLVVPTTQPAVVTRIGRHADEAQPFLAGIQVAQ